MWGDPRRRRWILWGILAITFLLVTVFRLSTAVIAEDLMRVFGATGTQLGIIHATFFVVYALMQVPTGILIDRVGPRRTAAVGATVMNIGAIWFSLAGAVPEAVAARFLIGLGGSVIFVSMLGFSANWYRPDEFGTMNGLCFAVGGVGGILATTPFALVVDVWGWQPTFRRMAAVGLVFAALTALLVRDAPTDAGFAPVSDRDGTGVSAAEIRATLGVVVRDRWMWVVGIVVFCGTGVNLTIIGLWGIPYVAQGYGTDVQFASLFTMVGGVGAVIGPPALGWLGDRTDHRAAIVLVGGLLYTTVLGTLAGLATPPLAIVALAFFLIGFLLGAFVITYPLVKDRYPAHVSGIALGTVNGAGFAGASVLPTVMGWVLDAYWTGETVAGARVYTVTGYRLAFGVAALTGGMTVLGGLWLLRQEGEPVTLSDAE